MKIFLGTDHRGFELKNKLLDWLKSNGYQTEDCGAFELNPDDDYPDFAKVVAEKVAANEGSRGILLCGSGVGVDITANRISGIRCGLGFNIEQIKQAREDDDINILSLASDHVASFQDAQLFLKCFLNTAFDPSEKHKRRIDKID